MPQAISRRIVITAYDGILLLDLAGPLEALRVASAFGGPSPRGRRGAYECSVVSVRGGPVNAADGMAPGHGDVRHLVNFRRLGETDDIVFQLGNCDIVHANQ